MVIVHVLIILFISLYIIHTYLFRIEFDKDVHQLKAFYFYLINKLPDDYRLILQEYFSFYNRLSEKDKEKFEAKLLFFIADKKFIARQLPGITNEMRVLVSACAAQLTLGLPNVTLKHFTKILIYPNEYYSTINKAYHQGEVNPAYKIIVISWKSFIEGYIDPSDSRNLGLHEMTHALHLENIIRNGQHDFLDKNLLNSLKQIADETIEKPGHPAISFFRSSAFRDFHEFFAISVENYFERPQEMLQVVPEIYQIIQGLLKITPEGRPAALL